jgi:hypothetical protein
MARSASRKPPRNPFVVSLLAKGAHFADREANVARMAAALRTLQLSIHPCSRVRHVGAKDAGSDAPVEMIA